VSEVAVALTVVKKKVRDTALTLAAEPYGAAKLVPTAADNSLPESEVRPEKKPDVTVIYRMRAAAPPFSTTVFSTPLDLELAPDEEWHWAIVQARGYPPQNLGQSAGQPTPAEPTLAEPAENPALPAPQNSPAASLSQNPQ
jgi:hypothetical protein